MFNMHSVSPLFRFGSSGSSQEIPQKSSKHSGYQNSEQGSRYVVLSRTPAAPRVTIPHQTQWMNRPYLIAAISAVSIAALGFAAYGGYKHFHPQIPAPPPALSDRATAAFDSEATVVCEKTSICNTETITTAPPKSCKISIIVLGAVSGCLQSRVKF